MADLVSKDQRNEVAMNAAPYFVRVDVAHDPTSPDTKFVQQGSATPSGCGVYIATAISQLGVSIEDTVNVQVRIWLSPGDTAVPHLIYDRTTPAFSVLRLVADFMKAPRTAPLEPLSEAAMQVRRTIGGPFDTDQALMVASARFGVDPWPDAPPEPSSD